MSSVFHRLVCWYAQGSWGAVSVAVWCLSTLASTEATATVGISFYKVLSLVFLDRFIVRRDTEGDRSQSLIRDGESLLN